VATRRGAPDNELVEEIDSIFDRGAAWVGSHPQHMLIAIGVLLAIAAGVGFAGERRGRSAARAEAATAPVYDAYLKAMGAQPGDGEAPEPANPELGKKTRAEYAAKLLAAAQQHPGTAAATTTRLLAAKLLEQNEDAAGAEAARKLAAENAPQGTPLSAIAWSRWAVALENKGDVKAAAQAFEKAAEVESPGQVLALGDAARCYALLGENAKALALFARAEKLGAEVLPLHVRQRLLELRAAQGSAVKADAPGPPS
jgi:tetratricopeptide (TPR) repeat protein